MPRLNTQRSYLGRASIKVRVCVGDRATRWDFEVCECSIAWTFQRGAQDQASGAGVQAEERFSMHMQNTLETQRLQVLPHKYVRYPHLLYVMCGKCIVPELSIQPPVHLYTTMAVIHGNTPSYAKSIM